MEKRQKTKEIIVSELVLKDDELPIAEAVVAAYTSGHTADSLRLQAAQEDKAYVFDMNYPGNLILSGLRQAVSGQPARYDVFELSDQQRDTATTMLEEYEASSYQVV